MEGYDLDKMLKLEVPELTKALNPRGLPGCVDERKKPWELTDEETILGYDILQRVHESMGGYLIENLADRIGNRAILHQPISRGLMGFYNLALEYREQVLEPPEGGISLLDEIKGFERELERRGIDLEKYRFYHESP